MNQLLVLTNFSQSSYNAALYALQLAKNMRAGIKLCNVTAAVSESARRDSTEKLKNLADRLGRDAEGIAGNQQFQPDINYITPGGKFTDEVKRLVEVENPLLVVMGLPGTGALSRFFSGSPTQDLIDEADFPLLAIPASATFNGMQKIAFATDLKEGDTSVVQSLAGFARPFNTEILLAHVSNDKFDNRQHQRKVDGFLSEVSALANYSRIYYRHIKSADINHGLGWLANHGNVNMLAAIHRKHGLISGLFESSHTQRLAKSAGLPLILYPTTSALVTA